MTKMFDYRWHMAVLIREDQFRPERRPVIQRRRKLSHRLTTWFPRGLRQVEEV